MRILGLTAVVFVTLTVQMLAATIDPIAVIQSRLEKINCDPPVTYKTNSAEVYATIHCRDLDERRKVYNAFRSTQTLALTSSTPPPTVCVVLVFDPAAFQAQLIPKLLESNLKSVSKPISGKVLQKTEEGLLIAYDGRVDFVVNGPAGLVDNDRFSYICYELGEEYQYRGADGSVNTVRKYTASRTVATRRWMPLTAAQAKDETDRRVTHPAPGG